MEKNSNMLVVMNVFLMLLVVGLGVYLFVDKSSTKEPDTKPGDAVQEPDKKPEDTQTPSSTKDKLSETFTVTVNGKQHNVKVDYKVMVSENSESLAHYVATVYYDDQKFINYEYLMDKVILTEQEAKQYTIDDFDEKISNSDFKTIKGTNNQEYIGIYSNRLTESGDIRYLHIYNSDGKEELALVDKNYMTFEDIPGYTRYTSNYTKIDESSVTFLAILRSEQDNDEPYRTVAEYKVTFGDKLNFTRTNTYKNIVVSGDVQNELNNVAR